MVNVSKHNICASSKTSKQHMDSELKETGEHQNEIGSQAIAETSYYSMEQYSLGRKGKADARDINTVDRRKYGK